MSGSRGTVKLQRETERERVWNVFNPYLVKFALLRIGAVLLTMSFTEN